MADCVAIAAELPFKQQVVEFAAHLSRSLPSPSDTVATREFLASFESQVTPAEGENEISDEKKREVVKSLVAKVGELRGGLEAPKEFEAESSHLLLQYLLSTNFDVESEEYRALVKKVIDGVKRGGDIAASAGRSTRAEAACRILNNTYNYLPPTSPLRPTALLALLSLLSASSDITTLPLSSSLISLSLSQWSISTAEKITFLTSASKVYESSGDLSKALELYLQALQLSVDGPIVDKALALVIADESQFDLDSVLKIQGVKDGVKGKMAELVGLFTEVDELEAVSKGQEWLGANASWVEGLGVAKFSADSVLRKIRLIALVALCSRSSSRQLQYSQVATALAVPESEVELWVIDAIRAKLIIARLSQPTSLIRIQKVTTTASRKFGSSEWELLERRLKDWKKSVDDARAVVEEAEGMAVSSSSGQSQRRSGQSSGQHQRRTEEEVVA